MIVTFGILGVMFLFPADSPQAEAAQGSGNLIKNVKTGDKVLLSSGIFGSSPTSKRRR